MFLGLLSLGAIVFAPVFVAKTSLRQRILPMLLPEYPAQITTGRASLLWWSSVELGDVQFHDTEGKPFLHIEKITSEKSLMALLLDQVRVGGFYVERPDLKILVRDDGSNLEDAIAPLLVPTEDSQGLDCAFHVRDGKMEIVDAKTRRKTELENVRADVRLPLDAAEAITVRGASEILKAGAGGKAGTVDFDVSYRQFPQTSTSPAGEAGTLRLKTSDLRLAALSALFGRLGQNVEVTGVVVSDLSAEFSTGETTAFKMKGGLNATGFSLAAPLWLGEDKLKLEYLTHQGEIDYQNGDVDFKDAKIKSDVLTCEAHGILKASELIQKWRQAAAKIPLEEFHLTGEVNVARIAKMLPETLRLRNGLELQTGKLLIVLDATTQNAEHQLAGKISTSQIAAVANGRPIVWDRPLEVDLKLRNTNTGPVLDELACRSDFLSLWAQGTPDNATIKAACKLDVLMTELNRFADLEGVRLAGRIDAGLTLRRLGPELVRGAASAIVKDFRFSVGSEQPWEEPQLILAGGGDVISPPDQPRRLQNLSVRITAGDDELKLTGAAPISWTKDWSDLAVSAELRGSLANWQNRLRPFVSTSGWRAGGNVIATAKANISKQQMTLDQFAADFQNLDVQSSAVNLSESRVHVETQGQWTAASHTLRLPKTTWASPSLSLRADDLQFIAAPEAPARTTGRVVFRGGAGELSRWFGLEKALPAGTNLKGIASGQIDLILANQAADANWNLLIENAALTKANAPEPPPGLGFPPVGNRGILQPEIVWAEDRLAFRGGGIYDFAKGRLELRQSQLEAPWLRIVAAGNIDELATEGNANLTGNLTCNLPLLAERFPDALGPNVQIAGSDSRPFSLRGPLWSTAADQRVPNDLAAYASLPWQRISYYGLQIGASELRADLNLGSVQLGPLDVPVGSGRLKLKSHLPLNAPALALQIEKGPLLENIHLSPELCRGWIKYAVPVLGDSTQTEGRFSASLTNEGFIPLANPAAMTAAGQLAIESVQMKPGRLANAFLDVVKQIKSLVRGAPAGGVLPAEQTLIRLDRQTVNVQCANGRVYHQNLKMVVTDIPITTTGSVGFDETLSLTAEIPIADDWVTQNRMLAGLKGQTLKIPVSGTLSQPVLDTRAIFAALRQAAQNATGRFIEDELQNQFERLFKKK